MELSLWSAMKNKGNTQGERESRLFGLQKKIGYAFKERALLNEALTHSSWANETPGARSNERLEFLGDAVLELAVSHLLYGEHLDMDEGGLTRLRAGIVCEKSLSQWAEEIGLAPLLRTGRSLRQGATAAMAADAAEALFGAVFLDGGYADARACVAVFFDYAATFKALPERDPKTELQELMQAEGKTVPYYSTIERTGPGHDLSFRIRVTLDDEALAEAWGKNIKEAEFRAAEKALAKYRESGRG